MSDRKYYNTTFYNTLLPILLLGICLALAFGGVIFESNVTLIVAVGAMFAFKFIHNFLEIKSEQQREDYNLVGYRGNLSDLSHEELLELSKQHNGVVE